MKITGDEKNVSSQEEIQMKLRATFPSTYGMNFFLINKQISNNAWKPVYKSEIQQAVGGAFEWNHVNMLAEDDIEREFRVDFYISQKSGSHKHCGQIQTTMGQLKEGQR